MKYFSRILSLAVLALGLLISSSSVWAAYTPAQCVNALGGTGVCYDRTGPGHCNSDQRDVGACTTADDHCCVSLSTISGITSAQCTAKPGYPKSGGCLDPADDWGARITDLGSGDWACCKYVSVGGSCTTPTGTSGTCNQNCPTGTTAVSGSTGCTSPVDKCCSATSSGTASSCTTPTGATGTCNQNCSSGTTAVSGSTGCTNALDKCCVSSSTPGTGTTPAANMTDVIFTNLLNYNDVNGFLGSVLTWLLGIIASLALLFIVIGGFLYVTSGGDSSRIETAKKCITGAVIGLALAIAAPAFLKEISIILDWNQVNPNLPANVGTTLSIVQILSKTLNFLLSIVGIMAIIMLVIGGIMYLTAAGNEDQIDRAKGLVKYAVIGILVALAGLVVITQLAAFFA